MKTPAEVARDRRNLAIAVALVAFVIVVFAVTTIRMSQNTRAAAAERAAAIEASGG